MRNIISKLLLLACIVTGSALLVVVFNPKAKYVYAVRERVDPQPTSVSWDLYCWREYSDGRIDKKFIGHFKEVSTSVPERIETSLCR